MRRPTEREFKIQLKDLDCFFCGADIDFKTCQVETLTSGIDRGMIIPMCKECARIKAKRYSQDEMIEIGITLEQLRIKK